MKKHNERSSVPQSTVSVVTKDTYINKVAALTKFGTENADNSLVFVSIRFVKHEFECFSTWRGEEMKLFWDFIRMIHQYTWNMLRQTGGKGANKAGMGYTLISPDKYPEALSKDIDPSSNLFELRVSQKARVHCFRDKTICYIYLLDKDHRIFPE